MKLYYYWLHKNEKERIKRRDGNKCLRCGSTKHLTVDHIIPKSILTKTKKHVGYIGNNYQTLCQPCNLIKGINIGTYREDKLAEYAINSFITRIEKKEDVIKNLNTNYMVSVFAAIRRYGKKEKKPELKIEHIIYMV